MNTEGLLKYGVVFVGVVLIISAINNLRNGYTYGLTGMGKFYRKDEPGHFMALFVTRILMGVACLGLVYFVPS